MSGTNRYVASERLRAAVWKHSTDTLPDEAKVSAPYVGKLGIAGGTAYPFCLPPEFAAWSLLSEVRDGALAMFDELGIPWHAAVGRGPSNHLLSSQVQCVNALGQMVTSPERIVRAFGPVLGTVDVEPIEPGRFLTFEYIGPADLLNEAVKGARTRGANCTSVDAAFLHRTAGGWRELVLLEWKYTESYRRRKPDPAKDEVRWQRYGSLVDRPLLDALVPFDELLQEPLYQLMRQQLLAFELERIAVHDVERVRVVHVLPEGNHAYGASLYGQHAEQLGATVHDVWHQLLRQPDRFVSIDSAVFCDPAITSDEYVARYAPTPIEWATNTETDDA